jgi:hypothetical protein
VFKTDGKSFYETIDQVILSAQINQQIDNKILKLYCWQVMRRTVENGRRAIPTSRNIGMSYRQSSFNTERFMGAPVRPHYRLSILLSIC